MSRKRIKIELSTRSINDAIAQIEDVKRNIVKCNDRFVHELAIIGVSVMKNQYSKAKLDTKPYEPFDEYTAFIDRTGETYTIGLRGKQVLFVEYGAGVKYVGSSKVSDSILPGYGSGYGPGTYPGQKSAMKESGWYFRDDGTLYHSYGTEATHPGLEAAIAIRNKFKLVAKRCFNEL